MRDSRMSEAEKEGPARQKEDCLPPLCGTQPARPGKGKCGALALTSRINYMVNSFGKVKTPPPQAPGL